MLTAGSGIDPDIHFILEGILHGFNVINDTSQIPMYNCKNYGSCFGEDNLLRLRRVVYNECASGKLSMVENAPRCIHAMGTIKKKCSDKIRPITDCSRPEISVNDFMQDVCQKFSYITIDQIAQSIVEGKYVYASTLDLANAYRSVLINPVQREFFGIFLDDKYYTDNFLCFGSKSAPFIFSRVTDSVCRYLRDHGIKCWSYLDDIICLSHDYNQAIADQQSIVTLVRKLGFYIAWPKVSSPAKVCTYLGIVLDLELGQLRLPPERLVRLRKELAFWKGRHKATEKQLQVLIGHLCHCSRIIRGGELYLHFLIKALNEAKGKRKIKLSDEFHQELSWWNVFAEHFNFTRMCNTSDINHSISMFSTVVPIHTDITVAQSIIEWPCVYATMDEDACCFELSLSLDEFVGCTRVVNNKAELFLPDNMVYDDVCVEICSLWAILLKSEVTDSVIQVNCHRKSTWLYLKKKRHSSNLLAAILRQIFWWSMFFNVKLVFVYDPIC